jgi:lysophospholipase L1-like esterase
MTWFPFRRQAAWSSIGAPVESGTGAVYDVGDIASDGSVKPGATPLVARGIGAGAVMSTVPIVGFLSVEFEAEREEVYWKSGSMPPVHLISAKGMRDATVAASAAAVTAAEAATTAQAAAEAAAGAVLGASDDAMTTILEDPDSTTRAAVSTLAASAATTAVAGEAARADATFIQVMPVVEGLTALLYGDSWSASDVNNTPGARWPLRVARRTGLTVTNRAMSGYCTADIARQAIATASPASPIVAGTSGVVIHAGGINDLRLTDDAKTRASHLYALRAFVAVAQAMSRLESSSGTITKGTPSAWQTNGLTGQASGDENIGLTSAVFNTAYSQYIDVPISAAGDYVILTHGTDGTSIRGARITATQAGSTTVVASMDAVHQPTGSGYPSNTGYGNSGILVRGLSVGTLRITFDAQGLTGPQAWFDALVPVNRVSPPAVILTKPPLPTNATWAKPTLLAALHANVDTIAAEFPEAVRVVDLSAGWNPATMLGSDGLHPNDLGEAFVAGKYMTALAAITARPGVHKR